MPKPAYYLESVCTVAAALIVGALASFVALLAVGWPS
jgi:uncharacterized membrane protein